MENHNSQANVDNSIDKYLEAPRLSSMWPYPLPVEKFPQFRNLFQESVSQPVSSIETNVSHQPSVNNATVNSMPVMGTLQTVLTTGINPTLNNGTSHTLNAGSAHTLSNATTAHTISAGTTHSQSISNNTSNSAKASEPNQIITRMRLQDLVREVDPNEQLDEEVEDVLLQMADDFVESAVTAACLLAKHRKSSTIEVKDLQLHLERNWNMWIPGFGTDELRPYKRSSVTEAHKQRLTLIRKTLKKY